MRAVERAHWSEKRVSGTNVGGIVGNYSSRLLHCKNTGSVTATGENAGGIAGKFSGFNNESNGTTYRRGMYDCWNSGSVSAGNYAGGIIGYLAKKGSNTDYEVINIVQASASINSSGIKGCFYGKTDYMTVIDGNLYYLSSISLQTSGVPGDYTSAASDTNGDGTVGDFDNASGQDPQPVGNSSEFITKMNTWLSAAKSNNLLISNVTSKWNFSNIEEVPDWTESW